MSLVCEPAITRMCARACSSRGGREEKQRRMGLIGFGWIDMIANSTGSPFATAAVSCRHARTKREPFQYLPDLITALISGTCRTNGTHDRGAPPSAVPSDRRRAVSRSRAVKCVARCDDPIGLCDGVGAISKGAIEVDMYARSVLGYVAASRRTDITRYGALGWAADV